MTDINKRIEEEANKYARLKTGYAPIEDHMEKVNDFVSGAKWRNNNLIDDIRDVYVETLPSGDCQAWDFVKGAQEFLKRLESLRIKP